MIPNEPKVTYVDGVRVYVSIEGGRLWAMVRAADKDTFDIKALEVGLKAHSIPAVPAVIDPETEEIIAPAVPASGPLIPAPGVTITEMGPHVLILATYDEDGNELTPPTIDARYHANFWISPALVERGLWKQWALAWAANGSAVSPNNHEEAVAFQGIELIDPQTVTSPANTML